MAKERQRVAHEKREPSQKPCGDLLITLDADAALGNVSFIDRPETG
jgi:hypothetical protein